MKIERLRIWEDEKKNESGGREGERLVMLRLVQVKEVRREGRDKINT